MVMFTPTTALDLENSIGFVKFYGFSPAVDFLAFSAEAQHCLCLGSTDIRHFLKTLASSRNTGDQPIRFYVADEHPAVLMRNALLLKIVLDDSLTYREKTEVFLDAYWNIFVTGKTLNLLQKAVVEVEKELAGGSLAHFDLSYLRFKDLDELMEILGLWKKAMASNFLKHSECAAKFLTNRQTALFKERWEVRKNVVDGDFIWGIRDNKILINKTDKKTGLVIQDFPTSPCIQFREYWEFRENGVSFAVHDSPENHKLMNPTMLSYQPGKSKSDRTSCEVLGFWGDISIGPFATFGFYADTTEKNDVFYETRNFELFHKSGEVATANLEKVLGRIGELKEDSKLHFTVVPFLKNPKKKVTQVPALTGKTDVFYVSFAEFCQEFEQKVADFAPLIRDGSVLVVETPKFLGVVDLKKRAALLDRQIDTLKTKFGLDVIHNLDHHLVCTFKRLPISPS